MLAEVTRLWRAGFVDACVCKSCSLGFAWPLVEGDAGFYSLLHERAGYPRERWEFRRARESYVGKTDRVLDIGAGRGDFLASLPAGIQKHAVEASPALCDELRGRGITAHASLQEAAKAGPYEVITLFHVLQYFADPVAALRTCREMLAPSAPGEGKGGGTIMISVPNASAGGDSIARITSPPHPLTRWTPTSVEKSIAAAGLVTVNAIEWIPRPMSALLWDAHAVTRAKAAAQPKSLAGRIDARPKGRARTALLTTLALTSLPAVLWHVREKLKRSQILVACQRA